MNQKTGRAGLCYLFVNIFSAIISFVSISVFSSLMTTDQYGMFTGFKAWGELLVPVIGLQLSNSLVPARNELPDEASFRRYHHSMLLLLLVVGGFFLFLGLIGAYMLQGSVIFLGAVLLFSLSRSTLDYYNNYWVIHGRYQIYSAANLFYYIGSFALPLLLLRMFPTLDSYIARMVGLIAAALAAVTPVLLADLKNYEKLCAQDLGADWRYAVSISWPCIFTGLSSMILGQTDRLLIKAIRGNSEAGIYGLIYNFVSMMQMFSTAVINMWIPQYIRAYQKKEYHKLREDIIFYLSFIAVISSGIFLLAPEVVRIMAPKNYWSGISMLGLLISGIYFHCAATFPKYVMTINKRTRSQAMIMVATTVCNVVGNVLLIPHHGMVAAAFTTFFSYGLEFVLAAIAALRIDSKAVPKKKMMLCNGLVLLMLVAKYLLWNAAFFRWSLGIFLGVGWIVFQRKKIKSFLIKT